MLSAVAAAVPVISFTEPVLIATSLYGTFALVSVFVFVLSEEPLEVPPPVFPLSEEPPDELPLPLSVEPLDELPLPLSEDPPDESPLPLSEESPPEDAAFTLTAQVAVLSSLISSVPLVAVTVIVAVPSVTAVTTPLETVATAVLSLDHVIVLSVALSGATVAVSVSVPFAFSVTAVLLRVTPVTSTFIFTVNSFD